LTKYCTILKVLLKRKDLITLTLLSFDTIGLVYCLYNGAGIGYITILGIVFTVLLIFTIKYSIAANISIIPHGMIFVCISILTKILMLIVIPLIILLYRYYTSDSSYKTDRRYRDGTKGNTKTAKVAAFAAIVGFLIGALVKNRKTKIVVEDHVKSDGFHSPEVTFKRGK
jgi:membrane associated rhomboid family serine protease